MKYNNLLNFFFNFVPKIKEKKQEEEEEEEEKKKNIDTNFWMLST